MRIGQGSAIDWPPVVRVEVWKVKDIVWGLTAGWRGDRSGGPAGGGGPPGRRVRCTLSSRIGDSTQGKEPRHVSARVESEVKASRRALLLGCVGLALAVVPRRAGAQQKAAQKVVQYQEKPKG